MRKKIISIIVTICLVSMVLPTANMSVKAVDHMHCDCGSTTCSGEDHNPSQIWQKWTTDNDLPVEDGYYYLTGDVTMSMSWDLYKNNIHLCLNGHTISIENDDEYAIQVKKDCTLVITDCESEGEINADSDLMFSIVSNSSVTMNNIALLGDEGTTLINVDETSNLSANNMETTCVLTEIVDSITNHGTAEFNNCSLDTETKSDSACIYNHGGTLTTRDTSIYLDGNETPGYDSRAVMNSDGEWYSIDDDIEAEDDAVAFGIENNGTAKTYIEDSYVSGSGDTDGYGIEIGFKDIDDEDEIYIYGECEIEGTTASIIQSRNAGLFASNEDNTKTFIGDGITIKYVKENPQVGDALVQDATEDMVSAFSVIYPENTYLKLSGTSLVTTNEGPTTTAAPTTTTVAPTTTTEAAPTSTEESSSAAPTTTVGPTTTKETTTAEPSTAAPSTEATTAEPTTEAPTDVPTVVPTTKEATTKAVETTKPTVKKVTLKKVKKGKKSAKVIWKKLKAKEANGYQIRYSLKKSMKKAKKKLVNTVNKSSLKIKKLKRKKKYYFQIRAYLDFNGERLYSAWSKKKSVKTK